MESHRFNGGAEGGQIDASPGNRPLERPEDLTGLAAPNLIPVTATGRRDAVRSVGAAAMALLAAHGLGEASAKKMKKKDHSTQAEHKRRKR